MLFVVTFSLGGERCLVRGGAAQPRLYKKELSEMISRNRAWVQFDGLSEQELSIGRRQKSVEVTGGCGDLRLSNSALGSRSGDRSSPPRPGDDG